jgi:hypothetical protein
MLAFDIETYGAEWTTGERKSFALCLGLHVAWLVAMVSAHARVLARKRARARTRVP